MLTLNYTIITLRNSYHTLITNLTELNYESMIIPSCESEMHINTWFHAILISEYETL